jgi:hypothetical protein
MSTPLSPSKLFEIARVSWARRVLLAATKVRLFDALRDGPLTGEALRERLRLHPRAIPDFPDALVALGVLTRDGDGPAGRYANTPEAARFLVSDSDAWIGGLFEMYDDRLYPFLGAPRGSASDRPAAERGPRWRHVDVRRSSIASRLAWRSS